MQMQRLASTQALAFLLRVIWTKLQHAFFPFFLFHSSASITRNLQPPTFLSGSSNVKFILYVWNLWVCFVQLSFFICCSYFIIRAFFSLFLLDPTSPIYCKTCYFFFHILRCTAFYSRNIKKKKEKHSKHVNFNWHPHFNYGITMDRRAKNLVSCDRHRWFRALSEELQWMAPLTVDTVWISGSLMFLEFRCTNWFFLFKIFNTMAI